MKLLVSVRKGKQSFSRGGLGFTANPIQLEVVDVVTDVNSQITQEQAALILGEAMLDVVEVKDEPKKKASRKSRAKKK